MTEVKDKSINICKYISHLQPLEVYLDKHVTQHFLQVLYSIINKCTCMINK